MYRRDPRKRPPRIHTPELPVMLQNRALMPMPSSVAVEVTCASLVRLELNALIGALAKQDLWANSKEPRKDSTIVMIV
jgi:hypothetical protein